MAYSRLIRLALAGAWVCAPAAAVAAGCPTPSAEVNGPAGQPLNVDEGGGRDRLLYEESHALLIGEANYATGSGWRVFRKTGISEATFYAWRKKYAGLMPSEMRRLRQLEEENGKLKRLVADLSLDKAMLQDVVSRKL